MLLPVASEGVQRRRGGKENAARRRYSAPVSGMRDAIRFPSANANDGSVCAEEVSLPWAIVREISVWHRRRLRRRRELRKRRRDGLSLAAVLHRDTSERVSILGLQRAAKLLPRRPGGPILVSKRRYRNLV